VYALLSLFASLGELPPFAALQLLQLVLKMFENSVENDGLYGPVGFLTERAKITSASLGILNNPFL
jgi:hypothetical protein